MRIVSWLLLLSVLAGCSGQRPRAEVFGRVTWKGMPVAQGNVRFQLADAPASVAPINDGQYRCEVYAGTSKVQIEAFAQAGPPVAIGPGKPPEPQYQQFLPPMFNDKSTLKVDVVAGRKNEHNFDLKP